jgi:hypothetical protein
MGLDGKGLELVHLDVEGTWNRRGPDGFHKSSWLALVHRASKGHVLANPLLYLHHCAPFSTLPSYLAVSPCTFFRGSWLSGAPSRSVSEKKTAGPTTSADSSRPTASNGTGTVCQRLFDRNV